MAIGAWTVVDLLVTAALFALFFKFCAGPNACCTPAEQACFKLPAGERPCCGCATNRQLIMGLGAFLGALAFLSWVSADLLSQYGTFTLVDGMTVAFFAAGCKSVHDEDKEFALPVLVRATLAN